MKLATDTDVLIDAFQLNKIYNTNLITEWITKSGDLTPLQQQLLDDIYQRSFKKVGGWNEEEVKMKLISFLFYVADIEEEGKIATFFERDLAATINGKQLSVACDCLIASPLGLSSPRLPYFFFARV